MNTSPAFSFRPHMPTGTVLADAYRFTRFSAIGFSILVPCLGAISATQTFTLERALVLGAVATAFHLFAYVSNDVADLDIDRTQPLRSLDPLVRGAILPHTALAFALLQIPLAFAISALADGVWRAHVALGCAIAGMGLYNAFGKRSAPLLMDAIQAAAWGALTLYGAFMVASEVTLATVILLACVFVYVLMINGVHGALRDLENDSKRGARTTAILLGASVSNAGQVAMSKALRWHAFVLYATFLTLSAAVFFAHRARSNPVSLQLSVTLYALLAAISIALLIAAFAAPRDKRFMLLLGMLHLVVSLALLVIPFVPGLNATIVVALAAVYLLPVMALLSRFRFRW